MLLVHKNKFEFRSLDRNNPILKFWGCASRIDSLF